MPKDAEEQALMAERYVSPSTAPGRVLSRREFGTRVGSAALAGAVSLAGRPTAAARAVPSSSTVTETAVARFYQTLKDDQKRLIAFPFDHPLRSKARNNGAIAKPRIKDLTPRQQELCREIMKGLCSAEGFDRFLYQMDEDSGGFDQYHVAIFGEPGTDQLFEWSLTGRHVTLRADGSRVEGGVFSGPIFYGHAPRRFAEDAKPSENVWWYQAEQANTIFKSLDEPQQTCALVRPTEPDASHTSELKGVTLEQGLPVAELDGPQKQMVQKLLGDLLMPFRTGDVEKVRERLDESGGVDTLRLTCFQEGDIGDAGTWDIWKLEGPDLSWYFHGSPHVHAWLSVAG